MESAKCIICNSDNSFKLIHKIKDRYSLSTTYQIKKCNCGMVMLNPRPKEANMKKHYNYENYHPQNRTVSIFDVFFKLAQYLNNLIKNRVIKKYFKLGNILDYGAGDGQFQKFMFKNGWSTDIYEPILKSSFCNGKKIKDIDKIKMNYYDVITMFHSLEHIHKVNEVLSKINLSIKKDGILMIAIPNYNAYERKYFKNKWIAYDVPRHLYHFNYDSINQLLIKNNFKIVELKPMYLDTFYNIIMSVDKSMMSFVKIIYLTLISFYNIYRDNKQCSSMMLVCKKNEI